MGIKNPIHPDNNRSSFELPEPVRDALSVQADSWFELDGNVGELIDETVSPLVVPEDWVVA